MAPDAKPLSWVQVLRGGVRRGQLIAGMGLVSMIAGTAVSASVTAAWAGHGGSHLPAPVAVPLGFVVRHFWVWAILPAVAWLVGRILMDARPWTTALGAVATGELFLLVLAVVGGTFGWRTCVDHALALVLGVGVTRWALLKGRAHAGTPG